MPTTVTAPVRALRGVAVLSPWLAHLLAVDLLLSLMLPLKPLAPTVVYNVSSILANSVWSWIQRIFTARRRRCEIQREISPISLLPVVQIW